MIYRSDEEAEELRIRGQLACARERLKSVLRLKTYEDEEENDVEVDEVDEMVSDVVEGVVDEEVEVEPTEFDVEEGTLPVDGVVSAMVVEV